MAVINGTTSSETLRGTVNNDKIYGDLGYDNLYGASGNDSLYGGVSGSNADNDGNYLQGGAGNDRLTGADNATFGDVLDGCDDNDTLIGYAGNDYLDGGDGDDNLNGGAGDDDLNDVGQGSNTLVGGTGNDTLEAASWINTDTQSLTGGTGRDTFVISSNNKSSLVITDFTTGAKGDWLDISNLLRHSSNLVGNPFAMDQNYLRLTQAGADALLEWDQDGGASMSYTWQTVARLQNVNLALNTMVAENFIYMTAPDGSNVGRSINGSALADHLYGSVGNDTITGLNGYDRIDGGPGNDILRGGDNGTNADTNGNSIEGGKGDDRLYGADFAGSGDYLSGDDGDDTLFGYAGNDVLSGDNGNDNLVGGAGNDRLEDSGLGSNTLSGGLGNDTLTAYSYDPGDTTLMSGGAGQDVFQLDIWSEASLFITDFTPGVGGDLLDIYSLLSNVTGGFTGNPFAGTKGYLRLKQIGADVQLQVDKDGKAGSAYGWETWVTLRNVDLASTPLTADNFNPYAPTDGTMPALNVVGSAAAEDMHGSVGKDTLIGKQGADTLHGGPGNDTLYGGDTNFNDNAGNTLYGEDGNDRLIGANTNDILWGGLGNDILAGNGGRDYLYGEKGNDTLTGGADDDWLYDWGGDNSLNGGNGDDTLQGGDGQDTLTGGTGKDLFSFSYHSGSIVDTITDFNPAADSIKLSYFGITGNSCFDLLRANQFASGANLTSAPNADVRFFYNTTLGDLYFDTDGNGVAAPVLFAHFMGAPVLTLSDFVEVIS